jgi:hypothetical protein
VRTNATVPPTVQIGAGPGPSAAAIPTLSEYGLMLLSMLMAAALWYQRRTSQR